MRFWITNFLFIMFAASVFSEVSLASATTASDSDRSWRFTVWLDDTPIGYHQVKIERENNKKTVYIQADFDVRFLFLPIYSYQHENREHWENGCLVKITSTTNDNGDDYFISSQQREQQLAIETRNGKATLDGCVRSFAYWDVELLKSDRLLNTQTGEYQAVSVTDLGTGSLNVDDKQIAARHFKLAIEETTIDLWYNDSMHWIALESVTESGAVLRYLPENVSELVRTARS